MSEQAAIRRVFADLESLAHGAAELFCDLLGAGGPETPRSVALSGGSTPKAMLALLAAPPYRDRVHWDELQIFWSDERAVPPDDPESNYGMAREALLSKLSLRPEQVHRLPAEQRPLDEAAAAYEYELRALLPAGADQEPRFTLVLLGMGDDGHTASLFPESPALAEQERLVAANHVAKLNADRLTFTPRLINAAANVAFLIAGAGKAARLAEVLQGPRDPRRLPSQFIGPRDGTLYWLLDEAAAAKLS